MVGILGEGVYFLLAVAFYFFVPGNYLLSFIKQKLPLSSHIFLSVGIGTVFFTLVTYLLSWIHMPFLVLPVTLGIFYLSRRKKVFQGVKFLPERKLLFLFVALAAVFFSLQMIPNGNIGNTIYYFGDDPAHLAYINELRFSFPPQHPGFAGIPLRGYHFFYDFLIAQFANATLLSHFSLYFHFMPLLTAFGWAFGAYSLLILWTKRIAASLWAVFLTLFGSSFAYILLFANHPHMTLASNFGINQPNGALHNGPYSFSVVLVLSALHLIYCYVQSRNVKLLYLLAVLVGMTPMFKVYAGMILITGFGGLVLYELYRRNKHVLFALLLAGCVFFGTFGVFAGSGAGIFYLPLWPIERMFDGIFPEYGYKEKITTFTEQGVIRGLLTTHFYTASLFLIGNLGTRFIGILLLPLLFFKEKKAPSVFAVIVCVMMATSIILPLFFAQTINVFDMIQMTWYYPLFASLFAAIGLSYFFSLRFSAILKFVLGVIIVVATFPTIYPSFIKSSIDLMSVPRQSLASEYFQGMEWLKKNGAYVETVLDLPLGKEYTNRDSLVRWFKSTPAHIPAFGQKRMYVGNQLILFPNMPLDDRLAFLAEINTLEYAKEKDSQKVKKVLSELRMRNISYIYAARQVGIFQNTDIKLVYQNPSVVLYKVQ